MIITMFDYPLPNNGNRYDLSEEELVKLLEAAYNRGFQQGAAASQTTTTAASGIDDFYSEWR